MPGRTKTQLSRRGFLKFLGLAWAGSALAACQINPGQAIAPAQTPLLIASPSVAPPPAITSTVPLAPPLPEPTITLRPSDTTVVITPTFTHTATPIPPAATPTMNQGVLTEQQRQKLAEESLKYVASDEASAIAVARSLKYLPTDGHPSNMCGPLAVAQLIDAGLVSQYTDLHDFWLLDPETASDRVKLEIAFPREEFLWLHTDEPTNTFNFEVFPLAPGDFIFTYAGKSGSFQHMLTVTKVDSEGRAFTVTNLNTAKGYLIQEVMLYDPSQPGEGYFYVWTSRQNAKYGRTGFGGFDLWRRLTPVLGKTEPERLLGEKLDEIIDQGGDWHILIKQVSGKEIYERRSRYRIPVASIIKVPIAMLFFKSLELMEVQDIPSFLQKGADGRTYEQLLYAMLVESEEVATFSILDEAQRFGLGYTKTLQSWGFSRTDVLSRKSTPMEIGRLFEGLYQESFLSSEACQMILIYMSIYTPNDDLRLGQIRQYLPAGYNIYNKRGSLTENYLVVADAALIEVPTSDGPVTFVAEIFGYQGEKRVTYEKLEEAANAMAQAIGQFFLQL